jgi:membrane-bound serine protease (ClpP class)
MTTLILTLIILAFVLFFLELFAPGGILGLFGVISLVVAAILAYETMGMFGSAGILIGGTVVGLGLFFLEIKLLANSRFGKQFQHHDRQMAQTPSVGRPELVGKRGITLTTMAPSGKVKLENEIFEAASLGGLINKDATVEVVRSEHLKLTVKEI